MWAAQDSNLRLPPCEDANTTTEPTEPQALTSAPSAACTSACTSEGENAHADAIEAASPVLPLVADADQGDPLAKLAAELAKLSLADRERLAAMLMGLTRDATCP